MGALRAIAAEPASTCIKSENKKIKDILTNPTLLTMQPEKKKSELTPPDLLQPIKVITPFLEHSVLLKKCYIIF